MFALPSIWNLIISTAIFFVAAGMLRRYLDRHGIPRSMVRSLLVFLLASMASWGAGAVVDQVAGPAPQSATPDDFSQMLNSLSAQRH